ncbi:MAG: hypothetical protein ACHQ1D_00690 [Nitrososphaerales archaeon]
MPKGQASGSTAVQEGSRYEGTVVEYLGQQKAPSASGKKWVRHDFTIQLSDGRILKASTFGKFDTELVGETVSFDGNYNEKFKNIQVLGDVEADANVEIDATDSVPTPVAPKVTGGGSRTGKSTAPSVVLKQRTPATDLDVVRADAEAVFSQDVAFVTGTLGKNASAEAIATGVQALQAIRATIFIESNRRNRS